MSRTVCLVRDTMEIAVAVNGPESQHLTSPDALHRASHDLPSSINHLRRDTPPAPDSRTSRSSPQTVDSFTRHATMSSTNGIVSSNNTQPSPSSHSRNPNDRIPSAMFQSAIDGQDHDRMETDEESDEYESGADTPQNEEIQTNAGEAEAVGADPEAMDTTPDSPTADEAGLPPSQSTDLRCHYFPDCKVELLIYS